MTNVLRVQFVSVEEGPDLSVNFALWPRAHDTLVLLRSPHLEYTLVEEDRGIRVPPLDSGDQAQDLLQALSWGESFVVIRTERHQYQLDVSSVDPGDIATAKQVLRRMSVDGTAHIEWA